jgi:hypothetical protein
MSLVTREGKGSKLTSNEMDGNLEYLASSSFQDGVYSQSGGGNGEIVDISTQDYIETPFPLDDGAVGTYTVSNFTVIKGKKTQLAGGTKNTSDLNAGSTPDRIPIYAGAASEITGSGAILRLVITNPTSSSLTINVASSSVLSGGINYEVGDQLTFSAQSIGGNTTSSINITLMDGSVNPPLLSSMTVTSESIEISSPLIILSQLPSFDPGVIGALYTDGMGTLMVSQGEGGAISLPGDKA